MRATPKDRCFLAVMLLLPHVACAYVHNRENYILN